MRGCNSIRALVFALGESEKNEKRRMEMVWESNPTFDPRPPFWKERNKKEPFDLRSENDDDESRFSEFIEDENIETKISDSTNL